MKPTITRALAVAVVVCGSLCTFGAVPRETAPTAPARPQTAKDTKTGPSGSLLSKTLVWQTLNEPGCGGAMTAISVSPFDSRRLLVAGDMLGVGLSTDGGDHWKVTTGFKSWEIADFTWHPTDSKTVWVGTMSGPYVSHDGGKTWLEKRGGFPPVADSFYSAPIQKVLFDPADANHLLAFGGSSRGWQSPGKPLWGAVWESGNGGETWSRLTTITANGSSSEAGAEGRNVTCVVYASGAAGRAGTLYAAASGTGFLVSTDNGKTWTKRVVGLPEGASYTRFALHPTNPKTLWLAVGNYKVAAGAAARVPGGIWKTTDGGITWMESAKGLGKVVNGTDSNTTSRYEGIAVTVSDPCVLYTNDSAWSTGVLYKSADGGVTWNAVASKRNVGANATTSVGRLFQLTTGYPAGLSMGVLTVDPKNANVAYAVNSEFIARTHDGGKTWDDATAYPAPGTSKGAEAWVGRGYSGLCSQNFRFNPSRGGDALLLGMDAGKLWRSRDDLKTWTFHGKAPWPWGEEMTPSTQVKLSTRPSGSSVSIWESDGRWTTAIHGWFWGARRTGCRKSTAVAVSRLGSTHRKIALPMFGPRLTAAFTTARMLEKSGKPLRLTAGKGGLRATRESRLISTSPLTGACMKR